MSAPPSPRVPGPTLPRAFYVLLAVLATLLAPFVVSGADQVLGDLGESLLWVIFISVAAILNVPMDRRLRLEMSMSGPVIAAAAVALPAGQAALCTVLALSTERELRHTTSWWNSLFNRVQVALGAGVAALIVAPLATSGSTLLRLAATGVAVLVYNLVNIAAVALYVRSRYKVAASDAAKQTSTPYPQFALDSALVTGLAVLIVGLYESFGVWGMLLLAVPMWLGFNALGAAREAEDRAEDLADQNRELEALSTDLAHRVKDLEVLNRLAADLLRADSFEQVASVASGALRAALGDDQAALVVDAPSTDVVYRLTLPGGETAGVVASTPLRPSQTAMVEAVGLMVELIVQRQRLETERVELERELARNEKARTALSAQILEQASQERIRISLALHDHVLPLFTGAGQRVDIAGRALTHGDIGRVHSLLEEVNATINDGLRAAREMLEALRKQTIVPGGLLEGLRRMLDELAVTHGIHVGLDTPSPAPAIPYAVELLVLDSVRGLLANTINHANASRVTVHLSEEDDHIGVEVVDDGVGFDPDQVGGGSQGLALLATRAEISRARLTIKSSPGAGTAVRMRIPL